MQPRLELAHADPTAQLHVFQLSDLGGWTRSIVGTDVGHGKPLPLAPIAGARQIPDVLLAIGIDAVNLKIRPAGVRLGLYDSYMDQLAVTQARDHLADVIDEVRRSGEPVYVTRRGRRVAVIVDVDAYDRIVEAAEEATDRRELQAARDEDDYLPWDEVKADLGLG